MKRPIWQRVLLGEELWKDMGNKEKGLTVLGYVVVFAMFMSFGLVFVAFVGIVFAYRYRKLLKADNE